MGKGSPETPAIRNRVASVPTTRCTAPENEIGGLGPMGEMPDGSRQTPHRPTKVELECAHLDGLVARSMPSARASEPSPRGDGHGVLNKPVATYGVLADTLLDRAQVPTEERRPTKTTAWNPIPTVAALANVWTLLACPPVTGQLYHHLKGSVESSARSLRTTNPRPACFLTSWRRQPARRFRTVPDASDGLLRNRVR